MSGTIDLTNAKPCPDCRRMLTTEPKCCHCAERDAIRADNERLRKALEEAFEGAARQLAEPRRHGNDQYALTAIATTCELALAATPAQSLAAHDAALLREVAEKLSGEGHEANAYYRGWLLAEADHIEKEAANGSALLRDAKQALSDAIKQADEILDRQGIPRSNAARAER